MDVETTQVRTAGQADRIDPRGLRRSGNWQSDGNPIRQEQRVQPRVQRWSNTGWTQRRQYFFLRGLNDGVMDY